MRRAKIVCTLGPAVAGRASELVEAGMNVARLNLSHGRSHNLNPRASHFPSQRPCSRPH